MFYYNKNDADKSGGDRFYDDYANDKNNGDAFHVNDGDDEKEEAEVTDGGEQ